MEGRPVECADELPRGGSFGSFVEFRQLLAERAPWVYRNVATKLATFALGRAMTFADEPLLQGVVDRTRGGGGGLRTLIEELAASPLFVQP